MDDIYKILNKVQLAKKTVTFVVVPCEAEIVENVIKDVHLNYNKVAMKTQTCFTVFPGQNEENYDILDIEYMDDEIIEEGQLFP